MAVLKLILESFKFAWDALRQNILRTTLSLLGVTIGIFAIIAVFTMVDSLERSIKESLSFLDASNLNIGRFPNDFGPNYPWWKYINRPFTNYEEYEFLKENLKNFEGISIFFTTSTTPKFQSSSSNDIRLMGISHGHKDVYSDFPDLQGRYFSETESNQGANVAIIGNRVHKELFQERNPIGKTIKIKGIKYTVIGYVTEQGGGLFEETSIDENIYIPYISFTKIYKPGTRQGDGLEPNLTVKGKESDIGLVELESEIIGLLRTKRGIPPKKESNFAVNHQDAIMNIIGSTFDIIGIAGWAIGGFSILVGGFGIANIMFVSVRERTNIIGIQKSLGAKNFFILFQFLFEAVLLSLIGGGIGILLVYLLSFINLGSLELILSVSNVILGLGVAFTIGIISGIVPALVAARLDPVIAIRTTG